MTAPHADRDGSERVSYHHRDDGPWPYTAVLTTDQPDQPLPARLWDTVERLEIHDTRTQGLLDTIRHLESMLADAHAKIVRLETPKPWNFNTIAVRRWETESGAVLRTELTGETDA